MEQCYAKCFPLIDFQTTCIGLHDVYMHVQCQNYCQLIVDLACIQ